MSNWMYTKTPEICTALYGKVLSVIVLDSTGFNEKIRAGTHCHGTAPATIFLIYINPRDMDWNIAMNRTNNSVKWRNYNW